ncbi:MAG: PKD domain-containing protein [Saprospiraceae bacterium]|nr:PKD domain-containing protein [Saprospiraceae bacterium]
MKKIFLSFALLASPIFLLAQKHDFTLIFGYAGGIYSPDDDAFGINVMTFGEGSVRLTDNQVINMGFNDTDVSMSDADGNLIFYYNGVYIENADFEKMEGGDTLNVWSPIGSDIPQGAVCIPFPEKPQKYILIHESEEYIVSPMWSFQGIGLYYSIIDMNENGGLGRVVERKKLLISDTLTYGQLTAVRHANGRDWWVLVGESHTDRFYTLLIDVDGIHLHSIQNTGIQRQEGFGHAYFSQDGNKYVSSQGIDFGPNWGYLYSYDFDRCSGALSNGKEIHITGSVGSGVAISSNSRFLYAPTEEYLYQFDLQATDVAGSRIKVGTYNGHLDPFPTKFDRSYLAPDGKIYVVTSSGSRTLHVVNKPNELGIACDFQQPGTKLPCNNARSFPNFPNYRLGPLDGSPCDTLGLDNLPVAFWRSERDTLEPLHVTFHDLSYYEPTIWLWNFGDGTVGTSERHPEHTFPGPGEYEVCLTASNANATHTLCRTLTFTTSSIENPDITNQISVGPNPFGNYLTVALSIQLRSPVFRLYDQTGRLVRARSLAYGLTELETVDLPVGLYFWEVRSGSEVVKVGKMVKVE